MATGKVRREHDHPLGFQWQPLKPEIFDALGLHPAKSKAEDGVRASILTEAYLVGRANPDSWISYSRRKEWWSAAPRYRPAPFTYTTVTRSVDMLHAAGLLDHNKAPPGSYRELQSTFRASRALLDAFGKEAFPVVYSPTEVLIMRNSDGNAVAYRETEETRRIRKRVKAINEVVDTAALAHPALGVVADGARRARPHDAEPR